MPDWVMLTVKLEGCEPIDCRVEFNRLKMALDSWAIECSLRERLADLANRAEYLIESRGCGRDKP